MKTKKESIKKTLQKETKCWLTLAVIINTSVSGVNELIQNLEPEERAWIKEVMTKSTVFTTPNMCCLLPGLQVEK